MAKPRKQTYTLDMYLAKINEKDIRSDQDVQRLSGQWDKSMVNEIISTVLTGGYIPPVILGEENNSRCGLLTGCREVLLFPYSGMETIKSHIRLRSRLFLTEQRTKMVKSKLTAMGILSGKIWNLT